MKKFSALFLAVIMIFTFTACSRKTAQDPQNIIGAQIGGSDVVNLAYNSADTFNPYTAKTTLNRNLTSLLYDPLVKIDSELKTVNVLAATTEINGLNCIVTLKSANFTDGSPLTAEDVVYSFNLAKSSDERYSVLLANVISADVRDASSVVFKLGRSDPDAINLLTFPIIKIGTDKLKNEDNVFLTPVGCGRYTLNSEQNELIPNDNWHGGEVKIQKINLVNAPDSESLTHSVEIGAIDYYYTDLSDCNIIRMSGNRVNVTLNNLVYIGMNLNSPTLRDAHMRHAISAAIDRSLICEKGYYNNALPAAGIFSPDWKEVSSVQTIEKTANLKIAIENLDEIGYNSKENGGFYKNANGETLSLTLLVNKENVFRMGTANLIVTQLAAAGIEVKVKAVPYEQYVALLAAGEFELYLAEVNIPYNMDISPLVSAGGSAAYGIPAKAEDGDSNDNKNQTEKPDDTQTDGEAPKEEPLALALETVIASYYSGVGSIQDVAVTAISDMPIVPVCYRTGVLFCSNKIEANNAVSASDIFFGFENINIK